MNIIDAMMVNLHLEPVGATGFQRIVEAELSCVCELPHARGDQPVEIGTLGLAEARMMFVRTDRPFTLHFAEGGKALFCVIVISGGLFFAVPDNHVCRRGDAFAIGTMAAWQASVEAGAHLCILALPTTETSRVLERFTAHAPGEALQLAAPFRSDSPVGRVLAALVTAAVASADGAAPLDTSPHTAEMIQDALITLLLESLPHNHSAGLIRQPAETAPLPVRRAVDFIVAQARRDIGVADVAAAADLSLRALQQNFRRFLKTSPQDYIKTVRLQGARRDLLDPASRRSIEDIASDWGFFNRGHFATQYRRIYGERPSETRRSR